MNQTHLSDTLKQAEKSMLGRLDSLIASIRGYSKVAMAEAAKQATVISKHLAAYAHQAAVALNLKSASVAASPLEELLFIGRQYWYIIAAVLTLLLAIPLVWVIRKQSPGVEAPTTRRGRPAARRSPPK